MFATLTKLFMPPFNTMSQGGDEDSAGSEASAITGSFALSHVALRNTHVSYAKCGCGVEGQLAPTCKRWRVAARAGVERRTRACAVVVCDGWLFVFGGGGVWSWRRCICVCIVCMCASWSVTCVYVHTLSCAIPGMCRTWGDRLGRKEEEGGPGCLLFHPRRGVGLKLA